MNQTTIDKQQVIKVKTPITVLTLISLFCKVLSSSTYFLYYYNYELTFRFPTILNLLSLTFTIAPVVLLFLYVFKFHKEPNSTIFIPICFGCMAVAYLLYCIHDFISENMHDDVKFFVIIFDLIFMIAYVLGTINALKGLSNKAFIIIPIVAGFIMSAVNLINLFSFYFELYIERGYTLYLFTDPAGIIASVTFHIALLLFCLKNTIPAIIPESPKKANINVEQLTPEQSLIILKNKLDLGVITQEEYQRQRAEIIDKL